ncbi:MAG: hypothetical protein JWP26_3342 [Devosia sp.]|nr:hypothetical protein [Devosia sp.]
MGMCLRGKMVDVGILPTPAVAIAETAPATPVPETAAVAEPEVAIAAPGLDVTPPAPAPKTAPDTLIAATFGLLRAEPDGSVVIAGSGTPGSEVEVYSNDQLLGKAKVESSGDWVLVPDAPIPPGGTELTLAEAGKQGRAAESFVVVVNDDKKTEPLVVASTPGAASDILQGLKRPAPGTTTAVAAAEPTAPTPSVDTAIAAAPDAATPATAAADTTTPTEPVTAEAVPATAAATEATDQAAAAAEPTAPTADVAATTPSSETPATAAPVTAATPDLAIAAVDPTVPAKPVPDVAVSGVSPTIDAIEIEGDKSFFAGGGLEGAVMRLYVDGKYIADATVADGRWLIEAGKVLIKPTQRIRVDMLKAGTADVTARAEVDFQVELPADKPTAIAAAEPAKPTVVVPEETAPASDLAEIATPSTTPTADDKAAPTELAANTVAPSATSEDKSGQSSAAPPAVVADVKPAEQPAAAIDNAVKPEAAATAPVETATAETTTPTVPAEASEPAVAASEPAVTQAAPHLQTAEAKPAVPVAEGDVPTMVAVAVGDPETARFASGKAIIRRGDNLWTIARRVYGAGIKYTTIYEANNGQIRNPNRIYPGQVFDLPDNAN